MLPAAPPDNAQLQQPSPFNDSQRRSVLFVLLDIHHRMTEMEATLSQSLIHPPFSEFVNDLSPTEGQVARDYFARIRTTMIACLQEAGIPLEVRRVSARWSLQCGATFMSVALSEISPERLRGYGLLAPAGESNVIKIRQDLQRLIDRLSAYLRQGLGRDLGERLARLQTTPASAATLSLLDRVITRWQLVEFRPVLDAIVRRLEAPRFEIAVFGRVSSGKSSLLNHLAGRDVLPVGVTPITAVPTRLVWARDAAAVVSFAEIEPRRVDLGSVRDYASEQGNPGNQKHVTGIVVQLPSARLHEGVVLVDTPGIGSLALSGSVETFAYLPRCDLGIVLIDAASALNQDDLSLLRALYHAGIPAQVLVSKADLLSPADCERTTAYLRNQLQMQLSLDLPVYPVSTVGSQEELLTKWFEEQIAPLWKRHRALAESSLGRKICHLRESVIAILETLLARSGSNTTDGRSTAHIELARRLIAAADAAMRQAKDRLQEWTSEEPAVLEIILRDAAQAATIVKANDGRDRVRQVIQDVLIQRSVTAHQLVRDLQQRLGDTLASLLQSAPLANADPSAMRDMTFTGLPAPDSSSLSDMCGAHVPWWTLGIRLAAARAARSALERRLMPSLREHIRLYDRQLYAWLKGAIGQLLEQFEAQAEVFREQLRRLTVSGDSGGSVVAAKELLADLEELQKEPADDTASKTPLTERHEATPR
jgi:GTP-binding protein EngB required for normal cell division